MINDFKQVTTACVPEAKEHKYLLTLRKFLHCHCRRFNQSSGLTQRTQAGALQTVIKIAADEITGGVNAFPLVLVALVFLLCEPQATKWMTGANGNGHL